ncbi:Ataxin-7-like protein 3 [Dimargaris xerosporica]|nr:Ataxin-7-like protein 3 [Dimargaris xerosporica]
MAAPSSATEYPSRASLCLDLFNELVDLCIFEVAIEVHKESKLAGLPCPILDRPGLDIFGNDPSKVASSEMYLCTSCQRSYPASRYAHHLEKCLGLSSRRQSRRAGVQGERTTGSPYTPSTTIYHGDDKDMLSEDGSKILLNGTVDRKRKHNGTKDPSGPSFKIKKSRSGSAKASPLLKASKANSITNGGETTEILANGLVPTMKSLSKPDHVHVNQAYPTAPIPHFESANPNDSDAGYIDVEDSEDLEEFFRDITALNGD